MLTYTYTYSKHEELKVRTLHNHNNVNSFVLHLRTVGNVRKTWVKKKQTNKIQCASYTRFVYIVITRMSVVKNGCILLHGIHHNEITKKFQINEKKKKRRNVALIDGQNFASVSITYEDLNFVFSFFYWAGLLFHVLPFLLPKLLHLLYHF